ncbi:uncharacterized protein L201_005366 [Kwoniella dendrophila CBS 6074]|uniref:Uncharacterized protein n=1 Tax=Kwoniella dendrophila CBS 6074 TaxID=1295534 RepID=A0AAX4JY74_9TREE
MSAEAGPGPSTMASSSMVPTAARLKVKKRIVNLVNPADPQEFSTQSISPSTSPNVSVEIEEHGTNEKKITPHTMRFSETTQTFTFNSTPGVKGILRSTGTPGSGNGVRFFPKNKFRIITPNASVHQPTPKPPPSPTNSFFSQLLAVTIPSMSPRRGSNSNLDENGKHAIGNESWEVPGQEGEVSLIASSIASNDEYGSRNPDNHYDEQVDEREIEMSIDVDGDVSYQDERSVDESWNGQPEIHCSPLSLPNTSIDRGNRNTSRDTSLVGFELPSAEMDYPEDMSNLLSTKFQPAEDLTSFSMNDLPSSSTIIPGAADLRHSQTLSPIKEDIKNSTEDEFWNVPPPHVDTSIISEENQDLGDLSNPTIRRPPSTTISNHQDQTISPTPVGRPYNTSSIFADMSAEQAELTWPLTRRSEEDDLDSNYPSPIKTSPSPSSSNVQTPKAPSAAGDITQFFDTTMTMSFSSPTSTPSPSAIVLRSQTHNKDLLIPTRKLFEAQVSHTSALTAELELYKDLAKRLQNEVIERDECLAKLNLRALDAEVLYNQVRDLEREVQTLKTRKSPSPKPSPTLKAGLRLDGMSDRTMAAQSEAKELEIRLAKTLADSEDMCKQLQDLQLEKQKVEDELKQIQQAKQSLEDQERDRLVKDQGNSDEIHKLQQELENAHGKIEELEYINMDHDDYIAVKQELEDALRKTSEMENQQGDLQALQAELDSAHRQLDEYELRETDIETVREELEETAKRLEQVQQDLEEANTLLEKSHQKDEEISALRAELQSAHDQLDEYEAKPPVLENNPMMQHELDEANEKIAELKTHVKELTENKLVDEDEIESLVQQVDKLKSYRKSEDEMRKRMNEIEKRLELEQNRRGDSDERLREAEEHINVLEQENEGLQEDLQQAEERLAQAQSKKSESDNTYVSEMKEEIKKLRLESSSKDLEILNLQRRKVELKEDREMLNIALDSKQQELELMKRKFAVKGIAGSTPLGTSRKVNLESSTATPLDKTVSTPLPGHQRRILSTGTGMQTRRRSSLALQTPLPNVPKNIPSNTTLETPMPGNKYGIQLHPSTKITTRIMKKVEEENDKFPSMNASIGRRRERM